MILKIIDKLLDQCTSGCRKKLVDLSGFMSIFEKTPDGVIMDLKKKSFALENEASGGEESEEMEDDVIMEAPENAPKGADGGSENGSN